MGGDARGQVENKLKHSMEGHKRRQVNIPTLRSKIPARTRNLEAAEGLAVAGESSKSRGATLLLQKSIEG